MLTISKFSGSALVAMLFCSIVAGQEVIHHGISNATGYHLTDQAPNWVASADGLQFSAGSNRQCYGTCEGSTGSCQSCNNVECRTCGIQGRGLLSGKYLPRNIWYSDQEYFQYQPQLLCPGERLYGLLEPQKANGREAQLVFYGFHFQVNPATQVTHLSRSGWQNVQKLSRILPITPGVIFVQPSGDSLIDESRAEVVRQAFATSVAGQGPVQVAIGNRANNGLTGHEAFNLYEQRQLPSPFSNAASTTAIGSSSGAGQQPAAGGNSPR